MIESLYANVSVVGLKTLPVNVCQHFWQLSGLLSGCLVHVLIFLCTVSNEGWLGVLDPMCLLSCCNDYVGCICGLLVVLPADGLWFRSYVIHVYLNLQIWYYYNKKLPWTAWFCEFITLNWKGFCLLSHPSLNLFSVT